MPRYEFTPAKDLDPATAHQLELDLAAVRAPRRPPAGRPGALERNGAANLAADPVEKSAGRYWVRIFYVSMGGEKLCADFGPYHLVTAERLRDRAMGWYCGCKSEGARIEHSKWCRRTERGTGALILQPDVGDDHHLNAIPRGVRRVVFPSQVQDGVIRVDDDVTIREAA